MPPANPTTRKRRTIVIGGLIAAFILCVSAWQVRGQVKGKIMSRAGVTVEMPGTNFHGALPDLTAEQEQVRDQLRADLAKLAGDIGERNLRKPAAYAEATKFVETRLTAAGYKVAQQVYQVKGRPCVNLIAEIPGAAQAQQIVVIGAHYDSAQDAPGANDNGTGTVSLLALADLLKTLQPERTLRLVAFANEEPPYFQTDAMGSLVYAKECKQRGDNIVAMLSLETMGYYDDTPKSQKYPPPFSWFYPSTGNFIAFVGNTESTPLVKLAIASFRRHAQFPSEGGAAPGSMEGVGWSDHWAFWQCGYPGVMVTDTAPFRYPHYHKKTDTPDKVDYDRLARVVVGLRDVVVDLSSGSKPPAPEPKKKLLKIK